MPAGARIASATALSFPLEPARLLLHGLFVLVGVATVMMGPLLPALISRWQLSDSTAGALFAAQFTLSVAGAASAGWVVRFLSTWRYMCAGYLIWGCGAVGLASSDGRVGFLGACLLGLGLGIVNPTANLAAASLRPRSPAAALNLLNFYFSIGAVAAPFAIGGFLDFGRAEWFPIAVAAVTISGALVALRHFVEDYQPPDPSSTAEASAKIASRRLRFALSAMAVLFIYVGVEVAAGGWTPTYLVRATGMPAALAATATSAFWGAILVTRLAAVSLVQRLGVIPILSAGAVLGLLGAVVMLAFPQPAAVFGGVALAGFGLGPVFASTVAYFLQHFGRGATRLTGVVFASGGTGGAVLPFLVGSISDATGNLRLALWVLPVSVAMILLLLAPMALTRPDRPRTGADPLADGGPSAIT